jgi:hypothetical protein
MAFGLTNPKSYPVAPAMFSAIVAPYIGALRAADAPQMFVATFAGLLLADGTLIFAAGLPAVRKFFLTHCVAVTRVVGSANERPHGRRARPGPTSRFAVRAKRRSFARNDGETRFDLSAIGAYAFATRAFSSPSNARSSRNATGYALRPIALHTFATRSRIPSIATGNEAASSRAPFSLMR